MSGPIIPRALAQRAALAAVLLGVLAGLARAETAEAVVEEDAPLAVAIDGRSERLDALIVRPAAGSRLPVALIVNGHFPDPKQAHPSGLAHLAHDFAERGWLAAVVEWRGYGASTGALQDDAGTCAAPDPKRYLDAHAADLAAALAALRARPDADPRVAIGLGISIGGASMLDLAASVQPPVSGVVNISGGVAHDAAPFRPDPACGPFEADLVRTVGAFGAARVPTLWIYAENDSLFRPDLVRRMVDAYRRDGGIAELDMLRPFRTDGHQLFLWEANVLTQPLIDAFLRAHHLPALAEDGAFATLETGLVPDDRDMVAYYLRMPTEKALAVPDAGSGAYVSFAQRSLDAARREAMLRCTAASRGPCHLAAENQTPLAAGRRDGPGPAAGGLR